MSLSKEEIALQITLKAIESNLVFALKSPGAPHEKMNSETASSVGDFYNTILKTIQPYK